GLPEDNHLVPDTTSGQMLRQLQADWPREGAKIDRARLRLAGGHVVASGRNPDLHKPPLAEARLRRYDPADLLQGLPVNNLPRRLAQDGDNEIAADIGKGDPLRLTPPSHGLDLGSWGARRFGRKTKRGGVSKKEAKASRL